MHQNGIYSRLSQELSEARKATDARLDRLEAKLDRILLAAGLVVEQIALEDPVDAEVVEEGGPSDAG